MFFSEQLPVYFFTAAFFILGAILGSFFNVCIWRIPRKESIASPPSHCPFCNRPIKWYDNIPLLSFIILKGKCRKCGKRISLHYPLVELLSGVLFGFTYIRYGFSLYIVFALLYVSFMIILTFIDLEHFILPDRFTLALIPAGVMSAFFRDDFSLMDSIIGLAAGGGLIFLFSFGYYIFKKKAGMGGGDIKLMAGVGAYLGMKLALLTILIGTISALLTALPFIILKKKRLDEMLPFGPFLAFGAVVCLFFGEQVWDWWLKHPLIEFKP